MVELIHDMSGKLKEVRDQCALHYNDKSNLNIIQISDNITLTKKVSLSASCSLFF